LDTTLQQRLIGAILLVTLGVIFIPVLLDGSGFKSRNSRSIEMPPEPEFPPLSEIKLEPVEPMHTKQKSAPAPVKKPEPSKPKTKTKLKQPNNAFSLQVSTVTIKGKTSYRVRIGPELDISRLEKMKATVKKEQGLDGFIVNHP
jgi:DedD protein